MCNHVQPAATTVASREPKLLPDQRSAPVSKCGELDMMRRDPTDENGLRQVAPGEPNFPLSLGPSTSKSKVKFSISAPTLRKFIAVPPRIPPVNAISLLNSTPWRLFRLAGKLKAGDLEGRPSPARTKRSRSRCTGAAATQLCGVAASVRSIWQAIHSHARTVRSHPRGIPSHPRGIPSHPRAVVA